MKHLLSRFLIIALFAPLIALSWFFLARASDISSTNFIIRDPVLGTGGGYGSSTSYNLFSTGNINLSARNSSTSFFGHYGFLYFPYVDDVVLTAVPNGVDADLSWPAAQSSEGLGWTVDGYNTGIASVSGGPYTYTDVGNVTSYTYENLAPGYYCFVLQTYDALGYVIATSNEECITIEQVIVFDLDVTSADTCSTTESAAPYTVALGTITATDQRVSGATDGVNHICVDLTTNAPGGAVVTVANTNGANGLVSTAVPGDTIGSTTGSLADNTERYGLCIVSTSATTGTLDDEGGYNGDTCAANSETNTIQGLTTTHAMIFDTNGGAVVDGRGQISVNGGVDTTTPAHADYTDTLTFIVSPTF